MSDGEPERYWRDPSPHGWQFIKMHCRRLDVGDAHLYIGGQQPRFDQSKATPVVVLGAWESPATWRAASLARRAGAVLVGFYESTPDSGRFSKGIVPRVRARFFGRLDAVVCAGQGPFEVLTRGNLNPSRLVQTINAVDNNFWRASVDSPAGTREVSGHHFVIAGQHISRKNTALAIDAFRGIAEPDDVLHVAGSGPLTNQLKQHVRSENITGVTFHGHLAAIELRDLFHTAQTLVLPSAREVWGLVVNEALATGMQVVVADSCGVAREIATMPGVELFSTSDTTPPEIKLGAAMSRARGQWSGRIAHPQILRFSPQRMADDFLKAFEIGRRHRFGS